MTVRTRNSTGGTISSCKISGNVTTSPTVRRSGQATGRSCFNGQGFHFQQSTKDISPNDRRLPLSLRSNHSVADRHQVEKRTFHRQPWRLLPRVQPWGAGAVHFGPRSSRLLYRDDKASGLSF